MRFLHQKKHTSLVCVCWLFRNHSNIYVNVFFFCSVHSRYFILPLSFIMCFDFVGSKERKILLFVFVIVFASLVHVSWWFLPLWMPLATVEMMHNGSAIINQSGTKIRRICTRKKRMKFMNGENNPNDKIST